MARARDLQTLIDTVEPVAAGTPALPEPVARRVLSVVARHARDAQDRRLLLDALGLIPDDGEAGPAGEAAASRCCVGCGRPFDHSGVRRRDRFCSARCYRTATPTAG
ncbi:hypothetical protein ACFXI0_34855 [Kitasatospora indigofera]|uniref:hypothetical protein n=1 Tax=Kitasatospora indigofera TaxID=67307 RepID=UPI0036C13A09